MTVIGYGNHETAIIKRHETDILQRFVTLLNYKAGSNVMTGGYGGWFIVNQVIRTNTRAATKIKYFHGSGGGGLVTKGALNLTRAMESYEGYDVFTMGHIHENSARNDVRDSVSFHPAKGYYFNHKQIHSMITGTYKEEYANGAYGWHVVQDCMGGGIETSFMAQVHQDSEIPSWIMKTTRLSYESMGQSRAVPWEADANWADG